MEVANGKEITFLYSEDGKDFQMLNATRVDGSYLPPWDRSIRVGLLSKGAKGQKVTFDRFELQHQ